MRRSYPVPYQARSRLLSQSAQMPSCSGKMQHSTTVRRISAQFRMGQSMRSLLRTLSLKGAFSSQCRSLMYLLARRYHSPQSRGLQGQSEVPGHRVSQVYKALLELPYGVPLHSKSTRLASDNSMQGSQGPPGPIGSTGPQGIQGVQGPVGATVTRDLGRCLCYPDLTMATGKSRGPGRNREHWIARHTRCARRTGSHGSVQIL
jgi:hypothetical protein